MKARHRVPPETRSDPPRLSRQTYTRNEPLIDISVPDVRRLDEQEKVKPDAAILDVPEGRLSFTLAIAPAKVAPEEDTALWIWKLDPLFSLRLRVSPPLPNHVLKVLPEHFLYLARNPRLFGRTAIAQDAGLVAFHRAINQSGGEFCTLQMAMVNVGWYSSRRCEYLQKYGWTCVTEL